jgi:hypothetical protein
MPKKIFTKKEIERLLECGDQSVKLVQQKKTSSSSEWWQYYHRLLVNDQQQPFVCCNNCKALLTFMSINGTNNLRTHFIACTKKKDGEHFANQRSVHEFYSSSRQSVIPRHIKLSITKACTEFCALDGRAFALVEGDGFQKLAKTLLDTGRSLHKSSFTVSDLLPHPTTVRCSKYLKK